MTTTPKATRQRKIPLRLKAQLVAEAGKKCANPGCPNWRTHIHHIKHWAVYKSHDEKHMIALCPSCHDEVHHGGGVSDDKLYEWKNISRGEQGVVRDHVYVEPSNDILILIGSMCVKTTVSQARVFLLTNANQFGFRVADGELLFINCLVKSLSGHVLVKIVDNYITSINEKSIKIERHAGKFSVRMLDVKGYLPPWFSDWAPDSMAKFISSNESTILSLEVVRPGVVRLIGMFVSDDGVFAVTESETCIVRPGINPIVLVGAGESTVIEWAGSVSGTLFRFLPAP